MGGLSSEDAATQGIVGESDGASSPSAESAPSVSAFDASSAPYGFDDVSVGDDEEAARPASTGTSAWREEWEEPSAESPRAVTQSPVAVGEADSEPAADVQSDLAAESYALVSAEANSGVKDQQLWKEQKKSSESLK